MFMYSRLVLFILYQFALDYRIVWTAGQNCYFPSFVHHSHESIWMTDYGLNNLHQQSQNSNNDNNNNNIKKTSLFYSLQLPEELYNYKFNFLNLQYGWLQMLFTRDSHHAWLFLSCHHILYTKHQIFFTSLKDYLTSICSVDDQTTYKSNSSNNTHWFSATNSRSMDYTKLMYNNNNNENSNPTSSLQASLGYVKLSCSWQSGKNIYLVQYTHPKGKSIYQCVKFELINEIDSVSVFNLFLSEYTSPTADLTLCHPTAFKYDSSKWIASLSPNTELSKTLCPISGGFQISQILDLKNNEVLCEPHVYSTLESECMSGEGILWTFLQPQCNPFVQNYKTQFQCHSTWKLNNLNYILIYQQINQYTYEFYQLVYLQLPEELSIESKTYGKFSPIWIIYGLQLNKIIEQIIINRIYTWNSIERYSSKSKNIVLYNTSIKLYEVQIRRAFGNCDDERVSCTHGCEHNARNQFFCHRSCLVPGQTCGNIIHDSCKFHPNYYGTWDLIEPSSIQESVGYEHPITGISYTMDLYCVKEIQESLYDRYILRSDYQTNGCYSRDLCLEIYRGNKNDFETSSIVNAILYRMSVGGKHLLSDICQFNNDNQLYGRTIYPLRGNILIRNTADKKSITPTGITKCGLYQIRLTGKLFILNTEPTQFGSQEDLFNVTNKQSINNRLGKDDHTNIMSHINGKLLNTYEANDDKSYQGPCSIEISDFNPNLGISGEFDNTLRIRHYCESTIYPSIFKSDHQCIASFNIDGISTISASYFLLITYLKITDQYYCLIIQINRNNDDMNNNNGNNHSNQNYTIFMYHSPQCQYETTPFEAIKLDENKAFAKLLLTSTQRQNDNSTSGSSSSSNTIITPILKSFNKSFYLSSSKLTRPIQQYTTIHNDYQQQNLTRFKALRFLSKPIKKTRSFFIINNQSSPIYSTISSYNYLLIFLIIFRIYC
ncbi:unnamed protein product [Schistosoma guineensis]|nr:unnamed protein product [Schistosoma guineensis]